MQFSLKRSIEILERTPGALSAMLNGLDPEWTNANEGENTWSIKDIIAHLILCEETNWLSRIRIILSDTTDKTFTFVDMSAHLELSKRYNVPDLLSRFTQLREAGIEELRELVPDESSFKQTALHPTLGTVNLQQLIATWVTHDLSHIAQITRVLAKQNKENVGPFAAFLKILDT